MNEFDSSKPSTAIEIILIYKLWWLPAFWWSLCCIKIANFYFVEFIWLDKNYENKPRSVKVYEWYWLFRIFTGRNEVVAKVMLLHVCVILFTGGSPCRESPPGRENPPGPGRHTPQTRQIPHLPGQVDPPWTRQPPSPRGQADPPCWENLPG